MDDGFRRMILPSVTAVLAFLVAGMLIYLIPGRYSMNQTVYFDSTKAAVPNPLMGYAPLAEDEDACQDHELVFILLKWSEWEPSEGNYDIKSLEENYHIRKWKQMGKHAVLRFTADYPSSKKHMDIPEWLYQKTKDGTFYDISYGKGYAPDYGNEYFRTAHHKAVSALADYCNQDSFVAFVELGSLGHWGEWHTAYTQDEKIPKLPDAEICEAYADDYRKAFTDAILLMRRNYDFAVNGEMGLYHDMICDTKETREWQSWIEKGSSQKTGGTELKLTAYQDYWQKAPAGGEMTPSVKMEKLLGENLNDSIGQVRDLHLTFIGPNCPCDREMDGASVLEAHIGYRFHISELETRFDYAENNLNVELTFENTGTAPFYRNWPVVMHVFNAEDQEIFNETLDLDLRNLMPLEKTTVHSAIPYSSGISGGFTIAISIISPDEKNFIRLAFEEIEPDSAGIHRLYTYKTEQN